MGHFVGRPFGTEPSALFDDDTHDVLLFTWETRGPFRGRAVGHPWATRLARYSLHFLITTRTMCCYLHGKRAWRTVGGPFGTVLSAFLTTSRAAEGQIFRDMDWGGVNINKKKDQTTPLCEGS